MKTEIHLLVPVADKPFISYVNGYCNMEMLKEIEKRFPEEFEAVCECAAKYNYEVKILFDLNSGRIDLIGFDKIAM